MFAGSLTWDLFKHYLFSRRAGALVRVVAWICILGVGLGVMSLVVILSVMNGFNHSLKQRLLAVEPHLIVTIPGINDFDKLQTEPVAKKLLARKDIQARAYESQELMIRTVDGFFGGGIARGVEPESFRSILNEMKRANNESKLSTQSPIDPGGPENPEDFELKAGEIMIGVDLAKSLGIFSGEKVTVLPPEALLLPSSEAPPIERVSVKGLLVTNLADIDQKILFYNRRTTFLNFRDAASKEVGIEVRLKDPDDYQDLRDELVSQGAKVTTWIDRNSSLFYALRMEKIAIGTFLALSALIASFSIVTVLVLLLTQKRKDIGVMMAMGMSPARTERTFLGLGLLLSLIGLMGGLILGLLVCWVISSFPMDILPSIYYERTIPARPDPVFIFWVVLVAALVASLSAYFPARRHTRMVPAEALRGRTAED
jgi:lipoprotein-releasing system permease protein